MSLRQPPKRNMISPIIVLSMILVSCHALAYGGDESNKPYSLEYYANNKLEGFLEKLKTIMRTGNATYGIPVLDPLDVKQFALHVADDLIVLSGLVTDLHVEKLSEYRVDKADLEILGMKASISLNWPLIQGKTMYVMNGTVLDTMPIHGIGIIKFAVKNFQFAADIKIGIQQQKLFIKSLKSRISLQSLDLNITGLYDDDDLSEMMSALISDVAPGLVDDYPDLVSSRVDKIVTSKLNEFLQNMSLKDLLELIN